MAKIVRVAAVSYAMPFHDHRRGVRLDPLAEIARKVMKDQPDFLCFPEVCACHTHPFGKGVEAAPEIEPFAEAVGQLARELNVNLVVPTLERYMGQVYNSVPIVDRTGQLVLVYRKNYPTYVEMNEGVTPGWDVPVGECDGVRVGSAVCFDANFPQVAAELERQRARLVFFPTMFWGGMLLQQWALRYGFYVAVAFGPESAIIDMSGRYLARQGTDTWQVRGQRRPPWAVAEINLDREVYHLDRNQNAFPAIRDKYGPDVEIEVYQPEAYCLLTSRRPGLSIEEVAQEFRLKPLRDYMAESVQMREKRLRGHADKKPR